MGVGTRGAGRAGDCHAETFCCAVGRLVHSKLVQAGNAGLPGPSAAVEELATLLLGEPGWTSSSRQPPAGACKGGWPEGSWRGLRLLRTSGQPAGFLFAWFQAALALDSLASILAMARGRPRCGPMG